MIFRYILLQLILDADKCRKVALGPDTGFLGCSGAGFQGVFQDGSTGKSAESRVSDPDFHWRTVE